MNCKKTTTLFLYQSNIKKFYKKEERERKETRKKIYVHRTIFLGTHIYIYKFILRVYVLVMIHTHTQTQTHGTHFSF